MIVYTCAVTKHLILSSKVGTSAKALEVEERQWIQEICWKQNLKGSDCVLHFRLKRTGPSKKPLRFLTWAIRWATAKCKHEKGCWLHGEHICSSHMWERARCSQASNDTCFSDLEILSWEWPYNWEMKNIQNQEGKGLNNLRGNLQRTRTPEESYEEMLPLFWARSSSRKKANK